MKKQTNQGCQLLLATLIILGVWASAFAQEQNNLLALNNASAITANENVFLKNAPEIFNFTYIKPNSLFVANFNRDDNYPKPDFSAMEKWYEIGKYEYDFVDTLGKIYIVATKKVEKTPIDWEIGWFDADGVRIGIRSSLIPVRLPIQAVPAGEPFKLYAYAPHEQDMPKVKSIVVTRVLAH